MKTLLRRGIGVIMSIVLVVLVEGCASIKEITEAERLEEQKKQEIAQMEELYNKIDAIGLEYYSGKNSILNEEFETFLEEKSISKETILDFLQKQEIFNESRYEEYIVEKDLLEEKLKNEQISAEKYEIMKQQLEKRYSKSKNKLGQYFRKKERIIFESSKDEINKLYNLLNTTKGTL